ncbi:7320_t:CDS:1, partial [Racocetra persica]
IAKDNPQLFSEKLKNYITSHEFWANVKCFYKVLELVKTVVKTVESSNIKVADVFLTLIKIAITIKAMPTMETTLERLEF